MSGTSKGSGWCTASLTIRFVVFVAAAAVDDRKRSRAPLLGGTMAGYETRWGPDPVGWRTPSRRPSRRAEYNATAARPS